jgi:hypothetical protein
VEFFDKKQDVIDLQMTQFGRYLLSLGKFKPVFYSFHDDNILYNVETAGISELQSDSQPRIKETPTLQPQISFSSLDKQFDGAYKKILMGKEKPGSQALQPTAIRNYMFSSPIGTSDINSDYAPAWGLMFLQGQLSGSTGYTELVGKSGGKNTLKISQLETEVTIETTDIEELTENVEEEFLSDFAVLTSEEDMTILLKVAEENAPFQKKNFDIEVYEIIEEVEDGLAIETLRPLYFSKKQQDLTEFDFINETIPDFDVTHVQHYFDLLTDDEIDDEMLCKYDPVQVKMGVFADNRTKLCQDVLNEEGKKVFDIYEDESDNPGEVC